MINLIQNEFVKILKKKSLYIVLIIILCYIILTNVMYKNSDLFFSYSEYSEDMITYYEEDLKQYNPKSESDNAIYIELKSQLDLMKLMEKYGFESWQASIISEYLNDNITLMNRYTYSLTNSVSKEEYDSAKEDYQYILEKLESNDWKYFVNSTLSDVNDEIQFQQEAKKQITDVSELNSINDSLHYLEVQKQVLSWRLEKDISYESGFLNSALENYIDFDEIVHNYDLTANHTYMEKQEYYSAIKSLNLNRYYIENNIKDLSFSDNRGILLSLFDEYELFILVIIIIISGSIVSDEFGKGTIKLLLIRPYSRNKILFAKFIVCICILILSILMIIGLQYIVGGIIQGFDSLKIPAIIYNFNTNQVETINIGHYLLIYSLAKLPIYILLLTLAFACSTIFTNTAIAIILPLLGYMASPLINQFAIAFNAKVLLYFVTPNWDFSQYLFGRLPDFEGLTMPFSATICFIYFTIMIITTFIFFKKRNIKNI